MSYQSDMEEANRAGLGHNLPPSAAELAVEETKQLLEPLTERRDQFVRSLGLVKVRNRAEAGSAADVIGLARGFLDIVDARRTEVTEPRQQAIRAAIAAATAFIQPILDLVGNPKARPGDINNAETAHGKIIDWQAAEKKRVESVQAEQRAEEARLRAQAAAAPREAATAPAASPDADSSPSQGRPDIRYVEAGLAAPREARAVGVEVVEQPKSAPIRGDLGFTIGRRKSYQIEIADITKIPANILDTPKVREAIISVVRPMVNNGMSIEGVRATEQQTNQIS